MYCDSGLSRAPKRRKRTRFPGNKLPLFSSDEDITSDCETTRDLMPDNQDLEHSNQYGSSSIENFQSDESEQLNDNNYHSDASEIDSNMNLPQYAVNDLNQQEAGTKQHELGLLIAKVFYTCGLNDQVCKKIYKLLEVVSQSNVKLLPHKEFIKLVSSLKKIPTSSYVYCKTHNTVDRPRTCSCNRNIGELEVFDIKETIKTIIQNNREYLIRVNDPDKSFEDLQLQSSAYQQLWSDTRSSSIIRISLICNIDDAQMMKTSRTCCTPISCLVAELPRHRRINKDNVFNLGVYWGTNGIPTDFLLDKCISNQFNDTFKIFDHVCNENHQLFQKKFAIDDQDRTLIVVIRFLAIVVDSVEKYKILNCKMFNGYYGCPYCTIKGASVEVQGSESRKFVYPYELGIWVPRKTCKIYKDHAQIAIQTQSPSLGIKGSCFLSKIVIVPSCVPIDYMHCILEGVFKFLMTLKPYSREPCKTFLDSCVTRTCLPHDFKRKFRKFSEMAYWRANEARTFLIYLIIYFKKLVDTDSFLIVFGLSIATRALCSDDRESAVQAKTILQKINAAFQDVYGESHMRFNLHLLAHLYEQYQNYGSLVDMSTFSFENNIFNLKRSFHGTRGQLRQIKDSYLFSKGFLLLQNDLETARQDLDPANYLDFIKHNPVCSLPSLLGTEDKNFCMDTQPFNLLKSYYPDIKRSDLKFYHQLKQDHKTYHSINYKYRRGSCSYMVSYGRSEVDKNFGKIICFVAVMSRLNPSNVLKTFVILKKFQKLATVNVLSGLDPASNIHLKELAKMTILKKYHHVINETSHQDLVMSENLKERAIAIKDDRYTTRYTITECDLPIDHD